MIALFSVANKSLEDLKGHKLNAIKREIVEDLLAISIEINTQPNYENDMIQKEYVTISEQKEIKKAEALELSMRPKKKSKIVRTGTNSFEAQPY